MYCKGRKSVTLRKAEKERRHRRSEQGQNGELNLFSVLSQKAKFSP